MNKYKCLLLNPPTNIKKTLGKIKDIYKDTKMLPIGVASLAGYLLEKGVETKILDAYSEELNIGEIVKEIVKYDPSFLGISSVTPVMQNTFAIAREVKAKLPGINIILGGAHPDALPEECLMDENIDYVIRGEGEITLYELIKSVVEGKPLEPIEGLCFKSNGEVIINNRRSFIKNLDSIPMPAYQLLPTKLYGSPPHMFLKDPVFQIIAGRGCPFKCIFCGIKATGKIVRSKSPQKIADEIEYLVENYSAKQIQFVDAIFPYNLKHAVAVCKEIISRGLQKKIVWNAGTRIEIVCDELLYYMKKAGCRLIFLGLESGNQQILDRAKKTFTLSEARNAVALLKKHGLIVVGSFIIGLPGETKVTVKDTIDFAKSLNIEFSKFNIAVPYPGTELYEWAKKENLIKNYDWDSYSSFSSATEGEIAYCPDTINRSDLVRLHKAAYIQYYLRPIIIFKHLKRILINPTLLMRYLRGVKVMYKGLLN